MIEKTLMYLEMLRISMYLDTVEQKSYPYETFQHEPLNHFQPLIINGYPVFQFRYEGAMPLYNEKNKEFIRLVRDYYFQATLDMYEKPDTEVHFNKAVLIIQHVFPNRIIRDVDNRNRKVLIDAIRLTGLINDDNFMELSIFEEGYVKDGTSPYVNAFLLENKNFSDFLRICGKLALEDFEGMKNIMSFEEFEKKYKERIERKKWKNDSETSDLYMNFW